MAIAREAWALLPAAPTLAHTLQSECHPPDGPQFHPRGYKSNQQNVKMFGGWRAMGKKTRHATTRKRNIGMSAVVAHCCIDPHTHSCTTVEVLGKTRTMQSSPPVCFPHAGMRTDGPRVLTEISHRIDHGSPDYAFAFSTGPSFFNASPSSGSPRPRQCTRKICADGADVSRWLAGGRVEKEARVVRDDASWSSVAGGTWRPANGRGSCVPGPGLALA
jgi:hypothetical protein